MPNVMVEFNGKETRVQVSPEAFRAFLKRRKALHQRALELEGTVNFLGERIPEGDYERIKTLNEEKAKDPVGFQALGFAQEPKTRAEIQAAVASLTLEGELVQGELANLAQADASLSLARALAEGKDLTVDPERFAIATVGVEAKLLDAAPEPAPAAPPPVAPGNAVQPGLFEELPTAGEVGLTKKRKKVPKNALVLFSEAFAA